MKTNVISVSNYRDIIKRKKRLKLEVKLLILKSLIHNKQLNPVIRSVFRFKFLTYWKKIYSFSNQQNICVFSGKKKTTFKLSSASRQFTKRLIEHGLIQGVKIK